MSNIITGPVALVKVQGITIGKIRDIRASENYQRVEVRGLGNLEAQEVPVVSHSGTFSASFFLVDLKSSGIRKLLNRNVVTPEQFKNTILLNENGVDIFIYKKVPKETDNTTGIVTSIGEEPIAKLEKCFLDSESLNISEGQLGSQDQSGRFLRAIRFND